jgi:hypothetical protein
LLVFWCFLFLTSFFDYCHWSRLNKSKIIYKNIFLIYFACCMIL